MAHGITETDTMAYAGADPWHIRETADRLTKLDDFVTSREMITAAGMDWKVIKRPIFDAYGREIPGYNVTMRSDNNDLLDVVTDTYKTFDNSEAFEFMDSLAADGIMRYETAGTLFGGRRLWILARLANDMKVADDIFRQYMMLGAGHDGKTPVTVKPTSTRVVCFNTYTAAINDGDTTYKVKHTRNMDYGLDAAREALSLTTDWNARMAEWMDKASVTPMRDIDDFVATLFGEDTTQAVNKAETFTEDFLIPEYNRQGSTVYSVFNAVTGYVNHGFAYRNRGDASKEEKRLVSITEGRGAAFMNRGLSLLQTVTG